MVGQISTCLAAAGLNIADLLNKSRGEYAYTLIDADGAVSEDVVARIRGNRGRAVRAPDPGAVRKRATWLPERTKSTGKTGAGTPGARPLKPDLAAVRSRIDSVDEKIHDADQ